MQRNIEEYKCLCYYCKIVFRRKLFKYDFLSESKVIFMTTFNGIIYLSAEEVYETPRRVAFVEGKGRGVLEGGYAPSFSDKLVQFEALRASEVQLSLGKISEQQELLTEKMVLRDLKYRYSGHSIRDNMVKVQVGVTCWQEYQQDYNRLQEQGLALQELGRQQYDDSGFYFSQGLGVAMVTCTRERDIVLGVRQGSSYTGKIHGAAGWMNFYPEICNIDPVQDVHRELQEELGISVQEILGVSLLGIVGFPHTREGDLVYVVRTTKEKEYFTSNAWMNAVDAKEHQQLVMLSNLREVELLLTEGKILGNDEKSYEVLPPTFYGLEQIIKYKTLLPDFRR